MGITNLMIQLLQSHCEDKNHNICRNVKNFHVLTLIKSTNQSCSYVQQSVAKKDMLICHQVDYKLFIIIATFFQMALLLRQRLNFQLCMRSSYIPACKSGRSSQLQVPLTPLLLWQRVVQSARTWLLSGVYRSPWQHEATLVHFTHRNWNVNPCICIEQFIIFCQWLIIVLCHK